MMSFKKPAIDYFFWVNSDWAYFGNPRLKAISERYDVPVNVIPIDVSLVLATTGGLPLEQRSKARQDYRLIELKRYSALLQMPINISPKHDRANCPLASLFLVAAIERGDCSIELIHAIMRALWVEERDIESKEELMTISTTLGLEGSAILSAAGSPEVAMKYRSNTERAIENGAFGSPFYIFDREPFWGQDRLHLLEMAVNRTISVR
ncbi:2-hydroxychromene-2-carboxylate isomerase [Rhizobium leguminosarum bv. viciae]|nr:2-hydroxychromene-2-carboxylate isomerase [Rhizobium leguminosarum]NKL73169.1 2-hydroxychromene-2-carboxylate isomerase [Rhizobium leguminosarum bv. viciae]